MRFDVRLPRLSDTIDEVVVISLCHAVGELVREGDAVVIVETDKVDADVPAPVSGTLVGYATSEGSTIRTGDLVCTIESESTTPEGAE